MTHSETATSSAGGRSLRVGDRLEPEHIRIDPETVSRYVTSVGDKDFFEHAESVRSHFGFDVAPTSVIDARMGSTLFRKTYGTLGDSLHAGQGFYHDRPLRVNGKYELSSEIEKIEERRGVRYVTFRTLCRDEAGVCLTTLNVKALHVPADRDRVRSHTDQRVSMEEFVSNHGGVASRSFPAIGAVVMSSDRQVNERMSLAFSELNDPDRVQNIHTDPVVAQQRGFERPIVKGLLVTVSEYQLYRELFGWEWYTRGYLNTKYIRPVYVNATLRALGVVADCADDKVRLSTAVIADGVVVAVGEAGIR